MHKHYTLVKVNWLELIHKQDGGDMQLCNIGLYQVVWKGKL